jgi:hypothetical protein
MSLPASDGFSASDGTALTTYSANWALNSGNFEIQSNAVRSNAGLAECAARWSADAFTANHSSQLKFNLISGSVYIGPAVRVKTDGTANYYGYYSSTGLRYLLKNINGTITILASSGGLSDQIVMGLEIDASTLTPKIAGGLDTELGAQTDSAHSTGAAGICGYSSGSGPTADDFLADNIGAAPSGVGAKFIRMQFIPNAIGRFEWPSEMH